MNLHRPIPRIILLLGILTLVSAPLTVGIRRYHPILPPADVAAPFTDPDGKIHARFIALHEKFLKRRALGPIGILFLGDSITQGWNLGGNAIWNDYYSRFNAVNFGIPGDSTQGVLWRIEKGELDGISPKVVVLLLGINNILVGYPANEVSKGIEKVVREIHDKLPHSRLLILGIFPIGADPADPRTALARAKIKTVNHELRALDDGNETRFLDIGDKFLDPNGKLSPEVMPDTLHPSAKGYKIWANAMSQLLNEMLKARQGLSESRNAEMRHVGLEPTTR